MGLALTSTTIRGDSPFFLLRCNTYHLNPRSKKIECRDFDTSLECNATPLFENTLRNVDRPPLRGGASGILPLIHKSCNREEFIAGA